MKERLDVLLVKRGLAESREKAKAIIMTGNVFVKNQREDKAGSTFDSDVAIEVKGTPMKYVSRGGYKLEKAIDLWQVPLEEKICMDVAFISLKKVLEPVKALLTPEGRGVCLVKPQFEAGREKVGKKGVVRDRKVHEEVIEQIMQYVLSIGFEILELSFSPIKGPEGNIEYLLYIENTEKPVLELEAEEAAADFQKEFKEKYQGLIKETVAAAHGNLDV